MSECSVCDHPEHDAINAALDAGESLRDVEGRYGVPRSTLGRHQQHRRVEDLATEEPDMPQMAHRTSNPVGPSPRAAAPRPPAMVPDAMGQAQLPTGPLLTVEEAMAALDQVRQELAQLPAKKRDLQQQLYAVRGQIVALERRVDREPGLDAPLADARRRFVTLDQYHDHSLPAEERALKAQEQAAEAALRQAEIARALEEYNRLVVQRQALWPQLTSHLDQLTVSLRAMLTLTQQQRDLASQAGFEFPAGQDNPDRLLGIALYGNLSRLLPTPPSLQDARLPLRPYADHDKGCDLVDHGTVQQAPAVVWVQLNNRQRGLAFVTEDLPFTGAEVHKLELGQPIRLDHTLWHTIRRQQQLAELLTLVPEPAWT
jgi:hypothetical protein